jgi:hypothetical protein
MHAVLDTERLHNGLKRGARQAVANTERPPPGGWHHAALREALVLMGLCSAGQVGDVGNVAKPWLNRPPKDRGTTKARCGRRMKQGTAPHAQRQGSGRAVHRLGRLAEAAPARQSMPGPGAAALQAKRPDRPPCT